MYTIIKIDYDTASHRAFGMFRNVDRAIARLAGLRGDIEGVYPGAKVEADATLITVSYDYGTDIKAEYSVIEIETRREDFV